MSNVLALPDNPRVRSILEAAMALADPHRRVAISTISEWEISTAWIPMVDFTRDDAPVNGYYETMVFGPHDIFELSQVPEIMRCLDVAAAREQHLLAVVMIAIFVQITTPRERRHGINRHLRNVQRHLAKQGLSMTIPLKPPLRTPVGRRA